MRFFIFLICLLITPTYIYSQNLPETDILLIDIAYSQGKLTVGDTHHIAVRPGYDNQPYFLHSNEGLLFSSNNGSGLTDIYLYYFSNGGIYNLTQTGQTAEYSPQQIPGQEKFTTVTVEEDGSTQRLWQFDFPGVNRQLTFAENESIGYYHWINDQELGAFVLGDSFTLHHILPDAGVDSLLAGSIGRCLLTHPPSGHLTYVHKPANDSSWYIQAIDLATGKKQRLMPTLPGVEDYVWLPDGKALMADKGIIYQWQSKKWAPIADLSDRIPDFYRMVIGPRAQKLAVVRFEGTTP